MKRVITILIAMMVGLVFIQCEEEALRIKEEPYDNYEVYENPVYNPANMLMDVDGEGGNNLSFPILWLQGDLEPLPGEAGVVSTDGVWWYVWGDPPAEPSDTPQSCPPDPDNDAFCDDGVAGSYGPAPGPDAVRAYIQKDPDNSWQAGKANFNYPYIHYIDWGDNLESVDWYTRSMVRTEVVLYQDLLNESLTQYEMRHVSGWGITEVHGMAATYNNGDVAPISYFGEQATVFSPYARMTIQKMNKSRDEMIAYAPEFISSTGWSGLDEYGEDLFAPAILNQRVNEAGEGHAGFSTEINVKGKIIYGFTWNVRNLNMGPGDYRLTFSFDDGGSHVLTNDTQIKLPEEDYDDGSGGNSPGGGGKAILLGDKNLSYIDIRILQRSGGSQGNGKGGDGGTKGKGKDNSKSTGRKGKIRR